jgi:archaemetzincin
MKTLEIVPLGNISTEILEILLKTLRRKTTLHVSISERFLEIPKECYDDFRHQYLGEKILKFLSEKFNFRILGLMDKDLCAYGMNFIFGQAQLGGKAAVVSIFRLKPSFYNRPENNQLLIERVKKECTHEVGHLLGLNHCSNKQCVMNFSNSIFDVDRKSENFCEKCRSEMIFGLTR